MAPEDPGDPLKKDIQVVEGLQGTEISEVSGVLLVLHSHVFYNHVDQLFALLILIALCLIIMSFFFRL